MFALVRTRANAERLTGLGAKNVHILEADITDVKALKVIFVHHLQAQELTRDLIFPDCSSRSERTHRRLIGLSGQ